MPSVMDRAYEKAAKEEEQRKRRKEQKREGTYKKSRLELSLICPHCDREIRISGDPYDMES